MTNTRLFRAFLIALIAAAIALYFVHWLLMLVMLLNIAFGLVAFVTGWQLGISDNTRHRRIPVNGRRVGELTISEGNYNG